MNSKRVTAIVALVCDDVRNESSGKEILIGVFADNVYVGVLPANLIVSLYIRLRLADNQSGNIKFRVMSPGGTQVTPEVPFALPPPADHRDIAIASMAIRGIGFQAQAEGRYEFQWQPPEQEWEAITSLFIKKGQVPVSTGGQPQPEQSPRGAPASSSPP